MWSSYQRSSGTQLGQISDLQRDILLIPRHFLTSLKLEKLTTKVLKQNFQQTLTYWVAGKNHNKFREFRTPFAPRYIRRNPCSLLVRDGSNTRNGGRLRSPSPIMASPHAALATIVPPCTCLTTDTLISWSLLGSGRLKCSLARVLIVTLCWTKVLTFATKVVDFPLLSIWTFLITIRSMTSLVKYTVEWLQDSVRRGGTISILFSCFVAANLIFAWRHSSHTVRNRANSWTIFLLQDLFLLQ